MTAPDTPQIAPQAAKSCLDRTARAVWWGQQGNSTEFQNLTNEEYPKLANFSLQEDFVASLNNSATFWKKPHQNFWRRSQDLNATDTTHSVLNEKPRFPRLETFSTLEIVEWYGVFCTCGGSGHSHGVPVSVRNPNGPGAPSSDPSYNIELVAYLYCNRGIFGPCTAYGTNRAPVNLIVTRRLIGPVLELNGVTFLDSRTMRSKSLWKMSIFGVWARLKMEY